MNKVLHVCGGFGGWGNIGKVERRSKFKVTLEFI